MESYAVYVIFIFFFAFIFIVTEIARRFLWMLVFSRFGEKRWKAWVPVADLWTVYKLGGFPGFLSIPVWGFIVAYIYMSFTEFDQSSPIALIMLAVLIPLVVVSLMACFRITKRLGLHGAYFLLYFAGEIVWLAVLVLMSPKQKK